MSFLRSVSRATKGATCAVAMAVVAMSSVEAQTTIINDDFSDGITNLGAEQLNFNITSSPLGLDLAQPTGPLDFASGDSGRSIHGTFPAQTLAAFGDKLTVTFDYTTPATIAYDGGTNGVTGSGSVSTNEDFKFGLFDTSATVGEIDPNTMLPIDFNGPVESSSSNPNPGLNMPGLQFEIDNVNAPGTDLGIRTHNVNQSLDHGFPTGRLFGTNSGFDFIAGGDDDVVSLLPNSDYTGTIIIEYTDATLTSFEITVGMSGTGVNGAYVDSFTRTVPIADTPAIPADNTTVPPTARVPEAVGVNTNTFDVIVFGCTTGTFGGTVGPTPGSSNPGEDNNGIDISNITIVFDSATTTLKGDADLDGDVDFADIPAFIAILQSGSFLAQADCDCSGAVDFADIPAFIAILQGG